MFNILQETAKLLSERLSGVPKSAEHRDAISVSQRRRLMVTGILRAVESVHSAEEASTSYPVRPTGRSDPHPSFMFYQFLQYALTFSSILGSSICHHATCKGKCASESSLPCPGQYLLCDPTWCQGCVHMCRGMGGGGGASSSGRMMDSAVLSTYKSELREFRALQEELEPWTAAFKAKHGCKPCLADVESTRATHPSPFIPPFTATVIYIKHYYIIALNARGHWTYTKSVCGHIFIATMLHYCVKLPFVKVLGHAACVSQGRMRVPDARPCAVQASRG